MKAFFAKILGGIKTAATKTCGAIKFAASKTWTLAAANKVVSIIIAAAVVVGTTCAIVLPIALHNHKFAEAWCSDAENHWHAATCKHEEEKSGSAAHTFDNDCDAKCDVCGYERTVGAHTYDNACDTTCNTCGATRSITHVFNVEAANTETLKAAATATTKAQYWKSCACGEISTTEYFETDKTEGTLANIQDLSKTYDKVELANPTYTTNSDGTATFEWYQGDTKLDAKPLNAGTYKVKVIIAESATFTGVSEEKEFTIAKKTLNYLELTKVYDGAGFIAYALGTEHGVVSGDVVVLTCEEEIDYYAGSYYFIDKTDDISLTDAGIDRAFLSGADAGNYQFANQKVSELDKYEMGGMLTVTKRPVWAENVEFTYNGENSFYGDNSTSEIVFQNVVTGETINACDIVFKFDNKDVGSGLIAVGYDDGITGNYEFDLSKCTASIVPKVLNNVTYYFTYNGGDGYKYVYLTSADHSGILGEDEIMLEVCFATPNVGAALDTSEETGFEPGFVEENYVLGTYDFKIVPYDIDISSLKYSKEYDVFNDTITVIPNGRLTGVGTETISFYVEMSTADVDSYAVGSYFDGSANTANYTFGGMTAEEFKEYAEDNAQITPKPLRMVGFAEKNYDGNNTFTYEFNSSNGTLDGDVFTVTFKLIDTATGNEAINVGAYKGATIDDVHSGNGNYVFVTTTCDAYVLDTNPLVLECDDVFYDEENRSWILLVTVKQGTLGIGDKIVLSESPESFYEVVDIEKSREFVSFAFVGDQVGIYLNDQELSDKNEIPAQSLMYRKDEIPEMATEFLAVIYLRTKEDGGRQSPVSGVYTPNMIGLGKEQKVNVELIDVYGDADDDVLPLGGHALVKITLTTPLPACMLETLEIDLFDVAGNSRKHTAEGSVYSDIIESHKQTGSNAIFVTDVFNTIDGTSSVVIKLTNETGDALNTLEFFVSGDSNSWLTDYSVKLLDDEFNVIEGTHNNEDGEFTLTSNGSRWSLAAGESCYVVLSTTEAKENIFVRLMSN